VIAGRHALQGLVLVQSATPTRLAASAAVDVAHLSSMLVLAALDGRRRRFGLREPVQSSAFLVGEVGHWWSAASPS
jgi:hypothetical protein